MFTTFPRTPVHDSFPRTPTSATKEVFSRGTPNKDTFARSPAKDSFSARYSPAKDAFSRTPTKDTFHEAYHPRSPASPKLKRDHRVARIYTPSSPTLPARPQTAHVQPDRPAPVLSLPGLPPQELPRSVLPPPKKKFGESLIKHGRSWLAQIRPPWSKSSDSMDISVIPPVTPRSPEFVNETSLRNSPKSAKFAVDEEAPVSKSAKLPEDKGYGFGQGVPAEEEYYCDPPPLYRKHPPEGGLKGWIAVAGAFLIQFCTIGFIFTWNVFEEHYNHVYLTDQNPIAVRFIGSLQLFFAFLLSLVAGKLTDLGYFRYVVHGGSVLFALCLLLLSFIGEEQLGAIIACQSIGMGIGIGLVFVPTAIVPLYYFKRRKGLALGIVMSGGSLGGMVFPAALRTLLSSQGFHGAVLITACIVLGFLVVGNGLSTYSAPSKQEKSAYPLPRLDLAKYSKDMGYIFAAGGVFLTMLIIYFPVMYLNLLGLEKGVDANTAFNTIIILSLSGIFGRVGLGFASDFVGPWNLMMPVSGFLALMMFTTCTIQGPKSLGAYAFFYGLFAGAWFSLMVTALSSLASRKTEAGTRVGLVLSASSIPMLLSSVLQHGILTPKHMWAIPSAIGGVLISGVTVLMYLSRMSTASKKQEGTRRRLPMLKDMPFLKNTNIKYLGFWGPKKFVTRRP